MNNVDYNNLRETSWRRKLTPAEEVLLREHLAAHPAARGDWETDAALNGWLDGLPQAPAMASNFTALVLQAVERDKARQARAQSGWRGWLRLQGWLPKAAVASLAVTLVLAGRYERQREARTAMARRVSEMARAVASSPELLENYDRIRRLNDAPPKGDQELIALLK